LANSTVARCASFTTNLKTVIPAQAGIYAQAAMQARYGFPSSRTAVRNNSADLKTVILAHAGTQFTAKFVGF